jgi:hypothetical protein
VEKPPPVARTCPDCGEAERRWQVDNRDHVNLSPLTDQCVACLIKAAKAFGPWPKEPRPWRRS